jgi:putative addiction module component (TIGR02574 family)
MSTNDLIKKAIALPMEERELLVDSLLRSLDQYDSILDKKWANVAQRRLLEMRSGKIKPVPGKEVFERILSIKNG